MTLPRPCELRYAYFCLYRAVPGGWLSGDELTWALSDREEGLLSGVIGWRRELGDVGSWPGAPHRGTGRMTEAAVTVWDWPASEFDRTRIAWECVAGNAASTSVARFGLRIHR